MPINSSNLSVVVSIDEIKKQLTLTDNTAWATLLATVLTQLPINPTGGATGLQGLVQGRNPNGLFYTGNPVNAYSGNNFANPDTAYGSLTTSIIPIVNYCRGLYTFSYKVRIPFLQSTNDKLTDYGNTYSGLLNYQTVNSANIAALLGATPTGVYLQVTGANVGFYQVNSVVDKTTSVAFGLASPPSNWARTNELLYLVFYIDYAYTLNPALPLPVVETEVSCSQSALALADITPDYKLNDGQGNSITPSIKDPYFTLQYPNSILPEVSDSVNPLVVGYNSNYNSGANIYTSTSNMPYIYVLVTTLTYVMITNNANLALNFTTQVIISGDITVTCDDCKRTILECYKSLYEEYKHEPEGKRKDFLKDALLRANYLTSEFLLNEDCGEVTEDICDEMLSLLSLAKCKCKVKKPSTIHEVIPTKVLISIGGGGTGSSIAVINATAPMPANGIVIFKSSGTNAKAGTVVAGDLFEYIGGYWLWQMNLIPAAPSANTPILCNDFTIFNSTGSNVAAYELNHYSLIGGKLYPNNSDLVMESMIVVQDGVQATLFHVIGVQNLGQIVVFTANGVTTVKMKSVITRISPTSVKILSEYKFTGQPDSTQSTPTITTLTVANLDSTTLDIGLWHSVVAPGSYGDVSQIAFKVTLNKSV